MTNQAASIKQNISGDGMNSVSHKTMNELSEITDEKEFLDLIEQYKQLNDSCDKVINKIKTRRANKK